MRYVLGILAALVVGCVTGGENGPKVIGYRSAGGHIGIPGHQEAMAGADSIKFMEIKSIVPVSKSVGDSGSFCLYLRESRKDGAVWNGVNKDGSRLIDKGNQCVTIAQDKKDTVTVDGKSIVVDVVEDPCIPFYYARDLKKE